VAGGVRAVTGQRAQAHVHVRASMGRVAGERVMAVMRGMVGVRTVRASLFWPGQVCVGFGHEHS
jgi:hypothetical protein